MCTTLCFILVQQLFSSCLAHGQQDIGADETIDYRSQDFAEVYADKPFDYIFDSVGGVPAICTHAVLVLHDAAC